MDNKFEKIIEYKKLKSSVRKPKYATRKLSIGLVSCMLGYALLVSPSSVEAAELERNTQAIEETAENESYVDTTNDTIDETSTVETGEDDEAATEETNEANNLSVTEKTKEKEDVSLKEAVHAKTNEENLNSEGADTEKSEEENKDSSEKKLVEKFTLSQEQKQALKDAGYTDNEIAKIEEGVANKLSEDANFDADAFLTQKVSEKASELEIDEEAKPEAVAAGDETEAGRDISNDITEAEIHVGNTQTPGVLKAGDGEGLAWSVAFKAPNDTKPGDYFDITLSDNWTLKGIEPDTEIADPINIDGKTVADGKRLSRQKIRYTFNENIKHVDDIRVYVQYGGYDVKEKVQDSKTQTFTISVGNYSDSKDLFVDYGNVSYDDYQRVLNGTSQYTHFDPDTGDFTQVFYINPESRYIGHSTGVNFNGSVGVILDGRGFDGTQSDVYFTPENTKVEIVKLAPRTKLPGAVYENPVAGEIDQSVNPLIQDGKISIDFNRNGIDNPYIITVKSKIDPNVKYINLGSRATLYGNGTLDLGLVNQIQFETGNTGGSGEEEDTYSLGDRVWLDTNKDGIQTEGEEGLEGVTVKLTGGDLTEEKTTTTDANGNYKFEGLNNGKYEVTFELPEGYDITKTNVGDDDKDSDGQVVTAEIKDADNMTIDLGLVKEEKTYNLGDRVWLDTNKDGIQTDGEEGLAGVTVKLTGGDLAEAKTTTTDANGNYKFEGLKNGDYTVTFETPEGYVITKTDEGTDDEKDSDGKEVTATIKDANNMSVDLGLVKKEAPAEETYAIGDRVWVDENKDGLQTEGEKGLEGVTVKLTGEGIDEQTTTTDANGDYKFEGLKNGKYKVTFVVPEGYDITKTDKGTDDEKDSDGKEVTATIKDADDMSIDLGLVKKEAPTEETYALGDRVWIDTNKDGLQTEDEKGVEGVTVKLTGGDLEEAKTTTTDANGNYKFEGLKNGDYKVTFEKPEGYEITKTDEGTDDEKDSDGLEVEATIKDADNMSVDLGLVVEEKTYNLGDRVWLDTNKDGLQTEDEKGVEGVTVKLTGGDLEEAKTTTTDANGNYKFEGLKNGDYKVTFLVPEDYEVTKTDQGTDDEKDSDGTEVTVTIKDADDMSIDLGLVKKEAPAEETYALGDRVWLDANKDGIQTEGEKGLAGVTVKLTGEGIEEQTTTTDENGNYKFEGLKNGEYKVTFELPKGYKITDTNIGDDDEKDSDGLEVTATIKDADNMSVDLGLIKVTETPWTPLEPSEPVEPETPGETPDIPWTPLEPSEPVEPEKPEKPETPETPDKPEKPGKSETPEDKKDNKVQVPVVESKKEAKKETPTRKKGNPKTGVGSISGAALGLIAAASGLFVSKKNKDEE